MNADPGTEGRDVRTAGAAAPTPTAAAASLLMAPHVWVRAVVLGLLFVLYHEFVIRYMFRLAWEDPNWSHAFLVPFISLYFVHQRREELLRTPARTCWWGLPVLAAGMVGYALGVYPIVNHMVMGYSMILGLFGLLWLLAGTAMMRILWLPVAYLVFAVKISYLLWEPIAWQLQKVAARSAAVVLTAFGIPLGIEAECTGTSIHIYQHGALIEPAMNVAEACSGLRMLMTLIALGVAVAYLSERPLWARIVLMLMTVPIAVLVNVGRVTAVGFLYPYSQDMSTGDFHVFIGMLMLVPALALLMLVSWFLQHLLIDDHAPAA
jgi:exosortase